jgi:3-oxoacid CoA-transferase subunit B
LVTVNFRENGDIANWKNSWKNGKGIVGAMDLVASAEKYYNCCNDLHTNKAGESLKRCSLPLTGVGCVTKGLLICFVLGLKNAFYLFEGRVSVEEKFKVSLRYFNRWRRNSGNDYLMEII